MFAGARSCCHRCATLPVGRRLRQRQAILPQLSLLSPNDAQMLHRTPLVPPDDDLILSRIVRAQQPRVRPRSRLPASTNGWDKGRPPARHRLGRRSLPRAPGVQRRYSPWTGAALRANENAPASAPRPPARPPNSSSSSPSSKRATAGDRTLQPRTQKSHVQQPRLGVQVPSFQRTGPDPHLGRARQNLPHVAVVLKRPGQDQHLVRLPCAGRVTPQNRRPLGRTHQQVDRITVFPQARRQVNVPARDRVCARLANARALPTRAQKRLISTASCTWSASNA